MSENSLNDNLMNSLLRQAKEEHVSHAYLLSGEDPDALLQIAQRFAKALTDSPADILYPEHEKPHVFAVDDVRNEINASVHIKPYGSRHKVYIVRDAALMNVQAQNALLKTLEEPPAYVVMILLSENSEVFLQTILSRCVKLRVYGEKQKDAEGLEEEVSVQEQVRVFLMQADRKDERVMLSLIDYIVKEKTYQEEALEYLRLSFRDVLLYKSTPDLKLLRLPENIAITKNLASRMRFSGIDRVLKAIDQTKVRLDANVKSDLSFELLLLAIQDEC